MLARADGRSRETEDAVAAGATAIHAHGLVLDLFPDPTVVLNMRRQILFANRAARRVLDARSGLADRWGRLKLLDRAADNRLAWFLAPADPQASALALQCAFRAKRQPSARSWFVTITRVPAARDGDAGDASDPAFLMHLVGRIHPRCMPVVVLQDLFGLSTGEIKVAQRVMQHESTPQIAKHLHRSHETVKACLKRIFRKCEVQSRADLIALLQRLSLFSADPGPTFDEPISSE